MTKQEIIEMAKQAGAMFDHMTWVERDLLPVFERFAKLVAEHEREACANECEKIALGFTKWPSAFEGITAETKLMRSLGEFVHKPFTEAIRARGQE